MASSGDSAMSASIVERPVGGAADLDQVPDRGGNRRRRHRAVLDHDLRLGVREDRRLSRPAPGDGSRGPARRPSRPAAKSDSRNAGWFGPSHATRSPRTTPRRRRPLARRRIRAASSAYVSVRAPVIKADLIRGDPGSPLDPRADPEVDRGRVRWGSRPLLDELADGLVEPSRGKAVPVEERVVRGGLAERVSDPVAEDRHWMAPAKHLGDGAAKPAEDGVVLGGDDPRHA